jgi:hypothetical protein
MGLNKWLQSYTAAFRKNERRITGGIFTNIIWGLWKEGNRMIFSNVALPKFHLDVVATG